MKDSEKKGLPHQLSLLEDFPVKTYPLQENKQGLSKESDQVYGRSLQGSSKMYSQRGQLLKMYQPFDLKDLPWSYKISARSGTMLNGIAFPVPQLVGYTEEIVYGSSPDLSMWATPNTMDHLPPRSKEAMEKSFATVRKGRTKPCNLREQVHPDMWPTPTVQDSNKATKRWRDDRQNNLTAAVFNPDKKKWPTPSGRDWKGGYLGGRFIDGKPSRATLDVAVQYTDNKDKKKLQLNPDWVEWLMGYPEDYTLIEDGKK